MANMTIRKLPDEVHLQLKLQAKRNSRSTEAEARHILATSLAGAVGNGLGKQLRRIWGSNLGGELHAERAKVALSEVPSK